MGNKNLLGDERIPHTLRDRAEALLRTRQAEMLSWTTDDMQALVYELNVCQIELELQDEELRQTQLELAQSRLRQ